jgi:hypothetical protein
MIPETDERLNLLVAYPYMKPDMIPVLKEHAADIRLVIDSGAFTAWKSGNPIALADYCRFIERLPVEPWRYFTLDIVGDAAGTDRQYKDMLRAGFNPVPIFTRGENPAKLDELYETSDLVGLGGINALDKRRWVNGIMRHVAGRRVHWLGFTNAEFMRHYRPYMADSSTWMIGRRRRFIPIYMGRGHVRQFKRHDFDAGLPWTARAALVRYGIDPAILRNDRAWVAGAPLVETVGAHSYVEMSLDVRRNLGTHVFLACVSADEVRRTLAAFARLRGKGGAVARPGGAATPREGPTGLRCAV